MSEKPIFVQLRLPPETGEYLRKAGAKQFRKLPAEILWRLWQSIERDKVKDPT